MRWVLPLVLLGLLPMLLNQAEGPRRLFEDSFSAPVKVGQVDGSQSPEGANRRVTDAEGKVLVDHGALRIRPMQTPGYGRASLAYALMSARGGGSSTSGYRSGIGSKNPTPWPWGPSLRPTPATPLRVPTP
jgi:hypothetical protein